MIGLDGCCRVAAMGESRCRAGELSESCVSGRASWGDGELAERARRVAAGVSAPAVSASDACGEGGARRPSTAAAAGDSIAAGIPLIIREGSRRRELIAGIDATISTKSSQVPAYACGIPRTLEMQSKSLLASAHQRQHIASESRRPDASTGLTVDRSVENAVEDGFVAEVPLVLRWVLRAALDAKRAVLLPCVIRTARGLRYRNLRGP